MKILFSNPPWWENSEHSLRYGIRAGSRWPFTAPAHCAPDNFTFGGYLPYPFFMGYAASYVQRAFPGAKVTLRDSIALRESYAGWLLFLKHTRPDWIILESATPSWAHDQRCIQLITQTCPEASIVVTGPIAQAQWKEALQLHGNVRAVIQGEYEKSLVRVIRGDVSGLQTHDLLTKEEMNRAPFPLIPAETATHYWDACPIQRTDDGGQRTEGRTPQLQVWSSRGCPYKCEFCVWPATMTGNDPDGTGRRTVRVYSAEYMAAFLEEAIATHGFRSIYDDSDTFNLVQKHTLEMCEVYRKTGLPWSAMCRADTIDRSTWRTMKASGCFGVKIGFESGVQRVIDEIIGKRLDLEEAAAIARFIRQEVGMSVHGTFCIGHPGETEAEQQATRRFIERLYETGALDTHQLSGTAEIEGTPLATLRQVGHLQSYPGARIDENYLRDADGQHKIETLRR